MSSIKQCRVLWFAYLPASVSLNLTAVLFGYSLTFLLIALGTVSAGVFPGYSSSILNITWLKIAPDWNRILACKGSYELLTGVLASNDMKEVAPFCNVSVTNCGWISVLSWVGFEWPPYCPGWNSLLPFPSKARVAAFEGSNSLCSSRRLILLSARNF